MKRTSHNRAKLLSGLILALPTLFFLKKTEIAYAADGTANAIMSVFAALNITSNRDLNFGSAPQGDPAATVASNDPANSARFIVQGDPNRAYTITLPSDGTVTMITAGGGSADREIPVHTFRAASSTTGMSDLTSTQQAQIGAGGSDTLTVGATRSALTATQEPGAYTAPFTVTVTY